jgi:ribosome recycling factor
MRDILETTKRGVRTIERDVRSSIQDAENNGERWEDKLKEAREAT